MQVQQCTISVTLTNTSDAQQTAILNALCKAALKANISTNSYSVSFTTTDTTDIHCATEIDSFVNNNKAYILCVTQQQFEQHINAFNNTDTSVSPVTVYTLSGVAVAWYDDECKCGYVTKQK
jgi:hypothetical protein